MALLPDSEKNGQRWQRTLFLQGFSARLLPPLAVATLGIALLRLAMLEALFGNPPAPAIDPAQLLLPALIAPVVEETFFRWMVQGVILHLALLRERHPTLAILLGALAFGAAHGNAAQGFSAALLGIFIGWVFWKSRSLVAAVTVHLFNNVGALLVYFYLPNPLGGFAAPLQLGLYFLAGLLLAVAGCWWLFRLFECQPGMGEGSGKGP